MAVTLVTRNALTVAVTDVLELERNNFIDNFINKCYCIICKEYETLHNVT